MRTRHVGPCVVFAICSPPYTGPKNDQAMKPEFDSYAGAYEKLLQDPIRDRFAAGSEYFHRRKADLIQEFFERRNLPASQMSWLDVGCGQGELLRLAGGKFASATGCDLSAKMITACGGVATFKQPSPTELPFADGSFDFVTAVCVYHHVKTPQRAGLTRSIYRVLRPGGMFCVIEHNPFNPITQLIVRRCPVDMDAELVTSGSAKRLIRSVNLSPIEMLTSSIRPNR